MTELPDNVKRSLRRWVMKNGHQSCRRREDCCDLVCKELEEVVAIGFRAGLKRAACRLCDFPTRFCIVCKEPVCTEHQNEDVRSPCHEDCFP